MNSAIAMPGNAATFLTHFFGVGLADDRYVVERFKAMVNGDIRRCPDEAPAARKGQRKTNYATVTLKAVKEMRPARNEIIVSTGLRTRVWTPPWMQADFWSDSGDAVRCSRVCPASRCGVSRAAGLYGIRGPGRKEGVARL